MNVWALRHISKTLFSLQHTPLPEISEQKMNRVDKLRVTKVQLSIYLNICEVSSTKCSTKPLAWSVWLKEQQSNHVENQLIKRIPLGLFILYTKWVWNDNTQVHIELQWVCLYQEWITESTQQHTLPRQCAWVASLAVVFSTTSTRCCADRG